MSCCTYCRKCFYSYAVRNVGSTCLAHVLVYASVREIKVHLDIECNVIFSIITANWFLATYITEHNVYAFETCDRLGPSPVSALSFFLHTCISALLFR
jgi:hypothetical protein